MKHEKAAFSERLREAMRARQLSPKAAVLEKLFNTNYAGESVSVQSVAAWLGGRSIPKPDKLRILADLLGVEPQHLHYGERKTYGIKEPAPAWPAKATSQDQAMVDALLALPAAQRKLVGELIRALAVAAQP